MREYVDGIQGLGAWDRLHDAIGRMEFDNWDLPPVEVDGDFYRIFPGSDREVTLEEVQSEIRRAMKAAVVGDRHD